MLDLATETVALPTWTVALVVALFAVATVLAFVQTSANNVLRTLVRAGVVCVGVLLVVWLFLDRTAEEDHRAERRALDARASELAARAAAPGSPLACLDAIAGEAVETACEQALFASPEVVASAVSYVSAKLNLLARGLEFSTRRDPAYASALVTLRQSLESDRFGLVAQVLSLRDSCTPAQCDTFTLLHDTSRVRANLKDRAFDGYVSRYAAAWSARDNRAAVADASSASGYTGAIGNPAGNGAAPAASGPTAASPRTPSHIDFPSANSIPAVSIMIPEPEAPAARAPAAPGAAPVANAPGPQRKPAARAAATTRTTPQSVSPPVPLAPSSQPSSDPGPSLQ
jgi:hypothetical protein